MLVKFFKFCLLLLFYQSPLYSKSKTLNDFNSSYLTNYFSGIVAHNNKKNSEALKFFETSKFLIKRHDNYLEKYAYSLVLEGKVQQATNEIKKNLTENKIKQMKEAALKEIKDVSIKIAVNSVKKVITTSVDKSKLDNLFNKNLEETKVALKKINS